MGGKGPPWCYSYLGRWRVTRDIVLLLCELRGVNVDMLHVGREGGAERLLNVTILVRRRECCFTCLSGKGHAKNAQPLSKDHHFPKEVAPCCSDV